MTRPSAPAIITAGALLAWAGAAYGYAAAAGNWYAGACGVLLTAGAGGAAWLLWDAPPAPGQLPLRWTDAHWDELERELNR